jgi:hypothetical protein
MSSELAPLLRLLIAAGGPQRFDAREQWPLHRSLVVLANRLSKLQASSWEGMPELSFRPDPDVGTRAAGVTRALWNLAAAGDLAVTAQQGRALFEVEPAWLPTAQTDLMHLDPTVAEAFYFAATCWAAKTATSEKNVRSSDSSFSERMRRSSLRIPLQMLPSDRRQAAVTRRSPR